MVDSYVLVPSLFFFGLLRKLFSRAGEAPVKFTHLCAGMSESCMGRQGRGGGGEHDCANAVKAPK